MSSAAADDTAAAAAAAPAAEDPSASAPPDPPAKKARKNLTRLAFVMGVHAGMEEEYEKRHSPIWEELHRALKDHGAHNYSIFLLPETRRIGPKLELHPGPRQLFAYVEVEDEERWNAIAKTEICQKWWAYMSPLMPGNLDGSPRATALKEVFHID